MRPLEDIRVIAVEQYGAGPFGTVHLADLGAEIIKIEDPSTRGDVGRYVPPFQNGEHSLFFETFNRNKRSISLDISSAAGREVFEDLVRNADVVYSNLRGDVPAALRLRYEDLCHLNPAIVCCSLSGFGMTGPRVKDPGYDYMLQGIAGWMSITGEPDGPPAKSGLSLVDFSGGFVAAIAVLAGVHRARRDGKGLDCDLSLFDVAISMLTYLGTWQLTSGYEPARHADSAHPSLVPFQNFQTSDGWIVVGCAKEKFWQRLVGVLDRPDLRDERFAGFEGRSTHAELVRSLLREEFATKPTAHWLDLLMPAGVPCAPVQSIEQALEDPHVAARNLIVTTEHPEFGTVRQLASPVRVGDEIPTYRRAPLRNEDADGVLSGILHYSAEQIADFAERGAFDNRTAATKG